MRGEPMVICPVCGWGLECTIDLFGVYSGPHPRGAEWLDWGTIVGKWDDPPPVLQKALLPADQARQIWDDPHCVIFFGQIVRIHLDFDQPELPVWHFLNGENDILFLMHRACREMASLVFRRQGHDNMDLFIQTLIYQRRKILEEMPELRLPEGIKLGHSERSIPVPPCYIDWGNQYYYNFTKDFIFEEMGPRWTIWDPIEVPGLTQYVVSQLRPTPTSTTPRKYTRQPQHMSTIETLPLELLGHIISYLPGSSVLSLQTCSKILLSKINPDQKFWRDELISGCIGALFDLDEDLLLNKDKEPLEQGLEWDWKGLTAKFKHLERNFSDDELWNDKAIPLHFRNRCRVWRITHDIEKLSTKLSAEGKFTVPGPFIEGIPSLYLDVKARDYRVPRKITID